MRVAAISVFRAFGTFKASSELCEGYAKYIQTENSSRGVLRALSHVTWADLVGKSASTALVLTAFQ